MGFSTVFLDNFRPEVVSDVISSISVVPVGVDDSVKLGNSRPYRSRDIRDRSPCDGLDDDEQYDVH